MSEPNNESATFFFLKVIYGTKNVLMVLSSSFSAMCDFFQEIFHFTKVFHCGFPLFSYRKRPFLGQNGFFTKFFSFDFFKEKRFPNSQGVPLDFFGCLRFMRIRKSHSEHTYETLRFLSLKEGADLRRSSLVLPTIKTVERDVE